MADADTDLDQLMAPPAQKKGVGIGVLIGTVILAVAASTGIAFVLVQRMTATEPPADSKSEHADKKAEKGEAHFMALAPTFVVNLSDVDVLRYLQVEVEVMSRDEKSLKKMEAVMPVIRNRLILLFGSKSYAELAGRPGKEQLQAEALLQIREALELDPDSEEIEAVYFTSFVMQ